MKLSYSLPLTLAAIAASLIPHASALPSFVPRIPNGGSVPGVPAVGHADKTGDSGDLDAFGAAFKAAGNKWTAALCKADSDGDGQTNGEELGDPCCTWTAGGAPKFSSGVSSPGDASSKVSASVLSSNSCNAAAPPATTAAPAKTTTAPAPPAGGPVTTTSAPAPTTADVATTPTGGSTTTTTTPATSTPKGSSTAPSTGSTGTTPSTNAPADEDSHDHVHAAHDEETASASTSEDEMEEYGSASGEDSSEEVSANATSTAKPTAKPTPLPSAKSAAADTLRASSLATIGACVAALALVHA